MGKEEGHPQNDLQNDPRLNQKISTRVQVQVHTRQGLCALNTNTAQGSCQLRALQRIVQERRGYHMFNAQHDPLTWGASRYRTTVDQHRVATQPVPGAPAPKQSQTPHGQGNAPGVWHRWLETRLMVRARVGDWSSDIRPSALPHRPQHIPRWATVPNCTQSAFFVVKHGTRSLHTYISSATASEGGLDSTSAA